MQNLNNHCIANAKLTRYLILANILVLMVVAQLNNIHYDPLRTFWGEMIFAWASISLFLLVSITHRQITIPHVVIPLALFGLYICLQPLIVPIEFIGISFTTALEMLLCILLAIACNTIIQQHGLKTFMRYICIALILGAILQSIIGLIQYNGWFKYFNSILDDLIFYDPTHSNSNIFGHFGQRNSYCHYLSWAVFALIYMRLIYNNRIMRIIFIPGLIWFIFSMTIAGSRSVFMYFIAAALISLIYLIKNNSQNCDIKNKNTARQLFYILLVTLVALIVFQYFYPLLQQLGQLGAHKQNISSGLQRIVEENGAGGIAGRRLFEWKKAFIVFENNPIFGYGLSKLPQQSVYLSPLFPNQPTNAGLFIYCHNLILQLMAETGLIGTLIVVVGSFYIIKKIWQQNSLPAIIILCMLATTIAHSMVEYPLWYLYFLGPFIMFLSIPNTGIKINNKYILGISAIPIIYLAYSMISSSIISERLTNYFDAPDNQKEFIQQAKYLENLANTDIIWESTALHTLDEYINVNDANTNRAFSTQMQLEYELRFTNTYPYPSCLLKVAMLYWNLDDKANAIKSMQLTMRAYPEYRSWFLSELHNKKYIGLYEAVYKKNNASNKRVKN
jgi:O-antigen ligase